MDPIKNYYDENNAVYAALIELMRPLILEAVARAIQDLNSQPANQVPRPFLIVAK
jgi:hypothetical protein